MIWPFKKTPPGSAANDVVNMLDRSAVVISWVCLGVLVAGFLTMLIFGNSYSGKATICEWMLACLLAGIFIGFLFGIPKILQNGQNQPAPPVPPAATDAQASGRSPATPAPAPTGAMTGMTYQQQVNTNLTEISDWLTKIIVGLGLVNLTKIPPQLRALATILANALAPAKGSESLAMAFSYATIITYTILGFLFGYIITRIFLARLFLNADRSSLAIDQVSFKADEARAAAESAIQKVDFALAKATPEIQDRTASEIPSQPDQILDQLIREYDETRRHMPASAIRTSMMTSIVGQMARVAPSVEGFDPESALKDTDDGKRLAAYAYLYARPAYEHLDSLLDALVNDPRAFNQYWAIQSLGKIQSLRPNSSLNQQQFSKLLTYFGRLQDGWDRKYELAKIFPALRP